MLVDRLRCAAGASRQRRSRPNLQVLNTALMTAQSACRSRTPSAIESPGDGVESAVGGHLANAAAASICEVFYWRERSQEVDFVVRVGRRSRRSK